MLKCLNYFCEVKFVLTVSDAFLSGDLENGYDACDDDDDYGGCESKRFTC